MPRLARWDDRFEFESPEELASLFHASQDIDDDDEGLDEQVAIEGEAEELDDEDLDILVADMRIGLGSVRRSPEPEEVRSP